MEMEKAKADNIVLKVYSRVRPGVVLDYYTTGVKVGKYHAVKKHTHRTQTLYIVSHIPTGAFYAFVRFANMEMARDFILQVEEYIDDAALADAEAYKKLLATYRDGKTVSNHILDLARRIDIQSVCTYWTW